jgi:hypothetical protein
VFNFPKIRSTSSASSLNSGGKIILLILSDKESESFGSEKILVLLPFEWN